MQNLSEKLKTTLIENNLSQYIDHFSEINNYFDEKCKNFFDANEHGHEFISKLVFFQTININRMKFLSDSYITELNHLNPLSANIILRAIMETCASLTHLSKSIFITNNNFDINFIEKQIELYDKLSFGDKSNPDTPNAINVLTTIKSLNYIGEKFNIIDSQVDLKEMYDILCEVAHPNFGGYRINMIETGKSTIQILNENRPFSSSDYLLVVFVMINKIYRVAFGHLDVIAKSLE